MEDEKKRLFALTKNVNKLLTDPLAQKGLHTFVEKRGLSEEHRLVSNINIWHTCKELLQEETQGLTEDEVDGLFSMGIPSKNRKDLTCSMGGKRSDSNLVIKEIQEGCANKIATLPEYTEFVNSIVE